MTYATPLMLVLGHQRCGAITSAIDAIEHNDGKAPGHIQAIVGAEALAAGRLLIAGGYCSLDTGQVAIIA